jgi:predicted metal-dependent hydrolase
MEYSLIRSKRKTIAICINKEGGVAVRAPLHAPQSAIDRFICEKKDWIAEKSGQMSALAETRKKYAVTQGSSLPLLGRDYPVIDAKEVAFTGTFFTVPKEEFSVLKPRLIHLYASLAKTVIVERTDYFSKKMELFPTGVRIGSANSYWGCCSGKNKLNFSWKLMMAESEVIDYVVVHELAHIAEHNHSERFWRLVEQTLPNYRKLRGKLKLLEINLRKQDWS